MSWSDGGLTIFLGADTIYLDPTIAIAGVCALLALLFLILGLRSSGTTTPCRWRRVRNNHRTPFSKWHCKSCVMEAFTTDRRPPKECKRVLRSNL